MMFRKCSPARNNFLRFAILWAVICLPFAIAHHAQAGETCDTVIGTPLSAVAVYDTAYFQRMVERTNKREASKSPEAPQTERQSFTVYDEPNKTPLAYLDIDYSSDGVMAASIRRDGHSQKFTPTIYDDDWGYGPWFYQTMLNRYGDWVEIALPLPDATLAGWIKITNPEILTMDGFGKHGIVDYKGQEIVIVKTNDRSVTIRDSQPGDEACEGTPPPMQPFKVRQITLDDAYDSSCNLLIKPTNLRGC